MKCRSLPIVFICGWFSAYPSSHCRLAPRLLRLPQFQQIFVTKCVVLQLTVSSYSYAVNLSSLFQLPSRYRFCCFRRCFFFFFTQQRLRGRRVFYSWCYLLQRLSSPAPQQLWARTRIHRQRDTVLSICVRYGSRNAIVTSAVSLGSTPASSLSLSVELLQHLLLLLMQLQQPFLL